MITSPKSLSRVDFAQPTEDPSYGKIKQLHNRWQEIHHEIDREKQSRRDSIEEQLQVL
jgi:chemotaxis regulatin CheY-phosphate phosphatase CheZ